MMRLRLSNLIAALSACGIATAQVNPLKDFVATDKDAYMLLPSEYICGPKVDSITWSPDSERLAVLRIEEDMTADQIKTAIERTAPPPEPVQQIVEWSTITHKSSVVYSLKQSEGQIEDLKWIAGSSELVVSKMETRIDAVPQNQHFVFLLSKSGAIKPVFQFGADEQYGLVTSSRIGLAALVHMPSYVQASPNGNPTPENPGTVQIFGTDGVLGAAIQMPSAHCWFTWSNDGRGYAQEFVRDPKLKRMKTQWYVLNLGTKKFETSVAPPEETVTDAKAPAADLEARDIPAQIAAEKLKFDAPTVVLLSPKVKEPSFTIVTTDGTRGELAPNLSAVSFFYQGSAMVRPLAKVSLVAMNRARDLALRAKLLSNAKQVALAMIMYSNDMDDNLPSNAGNWQSVLQPYLKNNEITSGFNYTFGGGNESSIASPATTQLGYFDGPGGRAVAFADGHCAWIPNP